MISGSAQMRAREEKATGAMIGRVGLPYLDDWPESKIEVGRLLEHSFWGGGLATEGALASFRHAFEELGQGRIISIAHPGNATSRRVMEKAGLTLQGETPE